MTPTDPDGPRATRRILASGGVLSLILVASADPRSFAVWRISLLPVALAAGVAGLVALVRLGLAEWTRRPTMPGAYLRAVGLFIMSATVAIIALT